MRNDQFPSESEQDDVTRDFWGSGADWSSPDRRREPGPLAGDRRRGATTDHHRDHRTGRIDVTGPLRAVRDGIDAFRPRTPRDATAEVRRTRRHGAPPPIDDLRRERSQPDPATGRHRQPTSFDGVGDGPEQWDRTAPADPRSRSTIGIGAVDPLLVRLGAVLALVVVMVPVVASLRPAAAQDRVQDPQVAAAVSIPVATAVPIPTTPDTPDTAVSGTITVDPAEPPRTEPPHDDPTAIPPAQDLTTRAAPMTTVEQPATPSTSDVAADPAATVDAAAERVVPDCPQTYEAGQGDSWYRIADEAGVPLSDVLTENRATIGTVIHPGDEICLPAGASMPTPPTTTVPPTTTSPTTTTPPPTTQPGENLTPEQVQQLIRETWPADEVDTALQVAYRESRYIATADNGWCCVGVFQIYWTVHQSWLDDFGITSRSDLFDARKNIAAAFHLWQSQGWGPWGG